MFTPYHQSSAFHSEYLIQIHLQRNSQALTIQKSTNALEQSKRYGVKIAKPFASQFFPVNPNVNQCR